MGSTFSSIQTSPNLPPKIANLAYVPKYKGVSSSKNDEDLKSISIHPNFLDIIKEPIVTNESLDILPRSLIIYKTKESPKIHKCVIKYLHAKDDNT